MPRRCVLPENSVCAQRKRNFWYNTQRQTHSCFDRLKRNLENFLCTSRQRGNPPLGAFSSASRTGLSRASLETRERTAPSFFSCETDRGKERKRKMGTTGARGARGSSHAFAFYGGRLLSSMSASWFVSYAYHEHVDAAHDNWNRASKAHGRISTYDRSFSYHRYWLDKVMTMNDLNLARNEIGLTPREVKDMANAVMAENW